MISKHVHPYAQDKNIVASFLHIVWLSNQEAICSVWDLVAYLDDEFEFIQEKISVWNNYVPKKSLKTTKNWFIGKLIKTDCGIFHFVSLIRNYACENVPEIKVTVEQGNEHVKRW